MVYDFLAFDKKKKGKRLGDILSEDQFAMDGLLGDALKKDKKKYDFLSVIDRAEKLAKEAGGDLLEQGKNYRIVKHKGEKAPMYVVSLPYLSEDDKKIVKALEKRAIGDIVIDPKSILDREKRKEVFLKEVLALIEAKQPELAKVRQRAFAELIVQDMVGYGLLEPLLINDALEEVMVIGTNKSVYVYHRKHGMCRTNIVFEDDEEVVNIIARIAQSVGKRIDLSAPLLDARLSDGSRVNATVSPISLDGPSLTIRKFKADPFTVVDILNFGTMSHELASFLWLAVEGFGVKPTNILVSGGTGSGKTTTLNCLGSFIPQTDRVITIEDTAELQLPIEHWVRLETRSPNVEGKGEVSMETLLKNTLRMRPDRIIVGEVRGSEAKTLLAAMNTGQNGCMGTVHANTAKETVTRLINSPMSVPMVMIPSLNLILMQNRFSYKGKTVRRITEIAEIAGIEDGRVKMNTVFEWDPTDDRTKPTGAPSTIKRRLAELRGVSSEVIEEELKNRERILRHIQEKGIRSIKEVGRAVNEYHTKKEKQLAEIGGRYEGEEVAEKPQIKKRYDFLGISGAPAIGAEKVLEQSSVSKIVQFDGEKTPHYLVPLPNLSEKEKETLREAEKQAISEIKVDPTTIESVEEVRQLFTAKVLEVIEKRFPDVGFSKRKDFAKLIVQNMIGYGLLEFLLDDDALEEIMVVASKKPVYVNHRVYGSCKTNVVFGSDKEIIRIVEKIASSVGRRIDKSTPLLDARLQNGSRVNATIPPISINGSTITIRKFREDPLTVVNLVNYRTLNIEVSAYIWLVVEGLAIKPGNILVAGGSSCGKTTTLNCLCSYIPTTARVITIEDTAELQLPIEHCIRLETRPPNVEGEGEVSMDDLVKNTLRMRPDRIIVGEVRGSEGRTLFTAMNTGHDGCMGTVHANSANETIIRLTNPPMSVPEIMLPALDLILMQSKIYHEGKTVRRITEIAEIAGFEQGKIVLNSIYAWDPKSDSLCSTGMPSIVKQKIAKLTGISMENLSKELERRETVLRWMVENGITDINEVSKVFNRYYTDAESLLSEVRPKKVVESVTDGGEHNS